MNADRPPQRNLRSLALRGIGWTVVEKWGIRLVSFGVFIILLRTLDVAEFGLASLATSVTMILLVFVDAGFPKALIQRKTLGPDDATTAFWTSCGLALVVYVVLFLSAPLFASSMDAPELTALLRVLGLNVFVTAMSSVPAALLERDMNFRSLGLRSIIGTVVGAAVAVPMALLGMGVWALIAQTLGTVTAGAIALWSSTRWRPAFRFSVSALREMASFGMSLLGIQLLGRIQQNIDKILVNVLLGAEAGGIYFIAQRAVKLIMELVSSVVSRVGLTTFSKLQDDHERLNRAFLQLTFAAGAVAIPVLGVVASLAAIIMPYVGGDGEWGQIVPIMQILALSNALFVISRFDQQVLLAVGQSSRAFALGLFENILGVALLVIAAPFGIVAVAFGRAARLFLIWPYRLYLLRRYAGVVVKTYVVNALVLMFAMVVPIGAMVVASLTPWRDTAPPFWTFAVPMSVVMLVVYYGMLWVTCGRSNRTAIRRTLARGGRR